MKYNHIILDMDGTIMNSMLVDHIAMQSAAEHYLNRDITEEEMAHCFGLPAVDGLSHLGIPDDRLKEAYRFYSNSFVDHIHKSQPYDGMTETMEELIRRGATLGIVTSRNRKELEFDMERFRLHDMVAHSITVDDVQHPKPNPESIELYCQLSGAKKEKCLFVGDTFFDSEAAERAGVHFALALWGATDPHLTADYQLKDPKEILDLL